MSGQTPEQMPPDVAPAETPAAEASTAEQARLAGLMAGGERRAAPDLEGQALRAAEAALRQGQQALAEAQAQLSPAPRPPARRKEQVLRLLLAGNLLLMVAVMLLPAPSSTPASTATPTATPTAPPAAQPVPPTPAAADDPYLRALAAADRGDYAGARAGLDAYLAASPRLSPGRLEVVYQAHAYYSRMLGDDARAEQYERKAAALLQSHTLPDDLLTMAQDAERRGDAAAMRRIYARFLLQQRQIPASLYKHIAEAYLKLGDSYRAAAEAGDEAARRAELEQLRNGVRAEAGGR